MAKNTGSSLRIKWGARAYPVNSVTFNEKIDEIDVTTSSTSGDGTDIIPNRMEGELKFEMFARETEGTEVVTGTLIAGQHYLVTGGLITQTGQITGGESLTQNRVVGEIFQSNGTETATATNKVKPLGAILLGKNMSMKVAGATIAVTSLDYNVEFSDIDVTDSSTTNSSRDWICSRAKRTSKVEGWINDTAADLITTSVPSTATSAEIILKAGYTVTGSAFGLSKDVVGAVNDATKLNYGFTWLGSPTVTSGLFLTPATASAFYFSTSPSGSASYKQYSGSALITNIAVSAGVNEPVKVSYTAKVVSTWNETVRA